MENYIEEMKKLKLNEKKLNDINKNLLNENGLNENEFLKRYKESDYARPSVTVDNLIFTVKNNELKILLIKRKNHPFINTWALPGGFVDCDKNGETTEFAAYRELKEETNLDNIYMEQLYTWSEVNRDPRMRVMSVAFMALINNNGKKIKAGDDAQEAIWFSVSKKKISVDKNGIISYDLILRNEEKNIEIVYKVFDTPRQNGLLVSYKSDIIQISDEKLAFDHINIINMGIDRLRNKVEYTPIVFNLLPSEFTLPQAQKIYEIILDKKLYKKNFRDKIMPMVIDIKKLDKNATRRPAKLYKYNSKFN